MKRVLSIACLLFCFALAVSLPPRRHRADRRHEDRDRCRLCDPHERDRPAQRRAEQVHQGRRARRGGKAAARLEVLFKNIHAYWIDKKIEDATTASQNVVTSLQAVQKALAANDMAAAETARATIGANCMSLPHGASGEAARGRIQNQVSSIADSQIGRLEDYKFQSAKSS